MRHVPKHLNALGLAGALLVHAGLLAYSAARHSPTFNELGHLPAGICHWQYAMFELYRVNPPLARMVATAPLLFLEPKTDWGNYQLDPLSRETIPMGIRFAKANGPRTFFLFTVARWACIPFCLLGAWTCYRWADDLWGRGAGWAAMLLWCFNPFVLGFGALVKPDVPAAAMGAWAAYRFWKWLREPIWPAAAIAGVALGLAELTKFTLLVFFLIWPAAWLVTRVANWRDASRRTEFIPFASSEAWQAPLLEMAQLACLLILAIGVINLGYAFAGSFQRLGDYRFQSRLLSAELMPLARPAEPHTGFYKTRSASKADSAVANAPLGVSGGGLRPGNRFAKIWLGGIPVPLPRDYVQGIDRQRTDFELGERSYLCGEWQDHGWWYYHLFGLAIKTPLGTLALLGLTVCLAMLRTSRRASIALHRSHHAPHDVSWVQPTVQIHSPASLTRLADELFLFAPAVAILALVSSQTGFSNHVRYTIPALPFLFIWCGKCLLVGPASRLPAFVVRASRLPALVVRASRLPALVVRASRLRVPVGSFRWLTVACWTCVAATALASLSVFPHTHTAARAASVLDGNGGTVHESRVWVASTGK